MPPAPSLSPELVLVSPDLRASALALLPERSPDGWIPPPNRPPPLTLVRVPVAPAELPLGRERLLAVRAALYAFDSATQAAVLGGGLSPSRRRSRCSPTCCTSSSAPRRRACGDRVSHALAQRRPRGLYDRPGEGRDPRLGGCRHDPATRLQLPGVRRGAGAGRTLRAHRPVDVRARAQHRLRHARGVEAAARARRDRRDRRLLLLALAPRSHDGAPRLGDAERRFRTWPREAKRPIVTDVYLPEQVAADFRTWLGGMAHLEFMQARGWIRVHELRDGDVVEIGGVTVRPFRLREDYVYAFELVEGSRRLLVAMDELNGWSSPPEVRGCHLAVLPMGICEFDLFTGERRIHEEHPVLRFEATFEETLGIVAELDAAQVVLAHVEEMDTISYDDLLRVEARLQAEGRPIRFAWDGMTVDV